MFYRVFIVVKSVKREVFRLFEFVNNNKKLISLRTMPVVKGTKVTKMPQADKKRTKKVSVAKADDANKVDSGSGDEADHCVDCGKMGFSQQQGLMCDGCGFWHHAMCEKVSDEVFNFLSKHDEEESILWYCKKCTITCKKMMAMMMKMYECQQQLVNKVDELSSVMNNKIDELSNMVNEKVSNNDMHSEPQKRVEDKVDELMNTVKSRQIDSHYVHDCVQDAVKLKLQEDQDEIEETKRRRCNVIVHGLKEESDDVGACMGPGANEDQVVQLLHEIGCDDVSVEDAVRLGKKQDDSNPESKPRPLKLVLASEGQKDKIFYRSKKLEREERPRTRQSVYSPGFDAETEGASATASSRTQTQTNQGEKNLIIVSGKIVTRRGQQERTCH